MIIYNQQDPQWQAHILGFNPIGAGFTIGSHGCLITSICSILSAHGIHITPPELNNRLKETGGYQEETGNYWWGSISRIFPEVAEVSSWSGNLQIIIDAINQSKGVMVEVDGKLNTTAWDMHFAAVHSVKDGIIYLSDPWGGVMRPLSFYRNVVKRITIYTIKKKYSMTDEQTNEFIRIIQGNPNIGTAAQREHLVNALKNKDYEYWNIYSPAWFNEMAEKASQSQPDVGTTNDTTRTVMEPAQASVQVVKNEATQWFEEHVEEHKEQIVNHKNELRKEIEKTALESEGAKNSGRILGVSKKLSSVIAAGLEYVGFFALAPESVQSQEVYGYPVSLWVGLVIAVLHGLHITVQGVIDYTQKNNM